MIKRFDVVRLLHKRSVEDCRDLCDASNGFAFDGFRWQVWIMSLNAVLLDPGLLRYLIIPDPNQLSHLINL